ncbi:lipid A-modifier LpxR family protein [Pseudooctadecabacter jejudonensis]|uniref:Lipid A deacylase LpxR family protein n=1 Tax=Pseudooctadecabacter jejudonensis TaxID=1391910 RepID=A0A1Y5SYP2_9RHOB|nr:lipid A-modifier LpxR family protein [Pseudooctadecabacter jejudonensis]SLN51133.1 hypothetical protein PSJ8397_02674 [Pseudooctadecabacter jejudonensis]
MRKLFILLAAVILASPAAAFEREQIGFGRLFTNDYFGDNEDRWRTGSYAFSLVQGPPWSGTAPTEFGALLEYRLRSEIIAPAALNGAGSDDRAYVGALSAGLHSHISKGNWDLSAGIDLVVTGPQTGLADAQDWFHNLVGAPAVGAIVYDNQVSNAVYPTLLAEAAYTMPLAANATLRPFAELQYGVEDLIRVGFDVLIGGVLEGDLMIRDSPSGQLYAGVDSGQYGTGFVFGADYAHVGDSAYFPASFGTDATDERWRVRAGFHSRSAAGTSLFYGLTYLSKEFVGQDEGQLVGSLKLNFNF